KPYLILEIRTPTSGVSSGDGVRDRGRADPDFIRATTKGGCVVNRLVFRTIISQLCLFFFEAFHSSPLGHSAKRAILQPARPSGLSNYLSRPIRFACRLAP